jgi:acetyl-CoA acyltransferase
VPGTTINRLCGSGMDAVIDGRARHQGGRGRLIIAGGVESMSRAPFVMPKAESAFSRMREIYDTTIGWRFVNPLMKQQYGVDSMPETGENVAEDFKVSARGSGCLRVRSRPRPRRAAQPSGRLAKEITPVTIPQRKGDPVVSRRTNIRAPTSMEALAKLKPMFRMDGTVTAGNAPASMTARPR